MLQGLQPQADDGLLALIGLFNNDRRSMKMDLGVGMFRDENGETPVLRVVKTAERVLLETQRSKGYLGPEGDPRFVELLLQLIAGTTTLDRDRVAGVQTPGGGGALRLATELITAARPEAHVWLGRPTWLNHLPVLASTKLAVKRFRYFDDHRQSICFDDMLDDLASARPGDVVLLQGCCHNPTGCDLDAPQWRQVTDLLVERQLMPLIDFAYHGLGHGLTEDVLGLCHVLSRVPEALVAYSCDKNFGLYRERTGALFVMARNAATARLARDNMATLARLNWSMPPDHGAAVVRLILESPSLAHDWRAELDVMRQRLMAVRTAVAATDARFSFLTRQQGMFMQLRIGLEAVARLRSEYGIYLPGSGRANLAGLRLVDISAFIEALEAVGGLASMATEQMTADCPVA